MIRLNLETPAPKRAEKRSNGFGMSFGEWGRWLGGYGNSAGVQVSDITAQGVAIAFACIAVTASAIGSLPFKLYKLNDSGKVEARSERLHRLLSLEPNPHITAQTFFEFATKSLLTMGNFYAEIQRDSQDNVIAIWPLSPHRTVGFLDQSGALFYRTSDGEEIGKERVLPAANVLHSIVNPDLMRGGGLAGVGAIQSCPEVFGQALAADKYASRFFANSGVPSIALKLAQEVDAKTKTLMREEWKALQTGENQHRLAILDQGADLEPFTTNPTDAALIPQQQWLREAICGVFGTPAFLVGSSERLSQNSAEQINLAWVVNTLRPLADRLTREITRKLLKPTNGFASEYTVEADFTDRLRGDFKSTMDGIAVARQWGIFTINDGRRQLGLNPISAEDGGDTVMCPVNMTSAKVLAQEKSTPEVTNE